MDEILKLLAELAAEQKSFSAKITEEIKTLGAAQPETKSTLEALDKRLKDVQTQADAIDSKISEARFNGGGKEEKTIADEVFEHEEYKKGLDIEFRGRSPFTMHFKHGAFPLSRKANITDAGLGSGTSGILMPQRLPGITILPMQELRIRDLMSVRPLTTGNSYDWVKQASRTNAASPQVEANAKAESTYDWETASDVVRTIAHYTNVSKQALSDIPWLRGQIDAELMYGLKLKEEEEVLAGAGTGEHLNGLITQATAFDTALLSPGSGAYTELDQLRRAKLQARLAGLATFAPDAFVLHPTDMAALELLKDNEALYIIGDPRTGVQVRLVWGLPVVESDSITQGTFLVGSFGSAAEIVDRMAVSITISFEHSSNFTSNLATILCEERIGLAVRRPGAFITGSFTSSPA